MKKMEIEVYGYDDVYIAAAPGEAERLGLSRAEADYLAADIAFTFREGKVYVEWEEDV